MEKIWVKQYQEGVPEEINTQTYASLVDLFNQACANNPQNTAYINFGTKLSYAELDQYSSAFAAYLQHLNIKPQTRIAIMMPNVMQYPVVLFGILRAGCIAVNTNPLYTADEVRHQINDAEAEIVIVVANFIETIEQALPHMPSVKQIVVSEIGDLLSPVKRVSFNAYLKHIKRDVPSYGHISIVTSFRGIMKRHTKRAYKPVAIKQTDLAFIQYTGGTTGISKGAMLSHGNLIANIEQTSAWLKPLQLNSSDIVVTALPLYHIFSLTANCLTFLKAGATNILITNPRDIKSFIKAIKKARFSGLTGVNTLFNALLHHKDFKKIDFSHVKLILSGGMPLQKNVANLWLKETNHLILEAYGLTETSPAVTMNPFFLKSFKGSIGLPLPSTEIAIRDDKGNDLPINEPGELCIKGPQVMAGYWHRDDETQDVFWPDGFLRTGDIAQIDKSGFIYLVDRKKDMILVSGFNVYPNEVEQVISTMPEVLEVGVIGIEDDSGELVKACIVKDDPNLDEEAVIAHCRAHLTAYKVPKVIEFYSELPKTNVGKILRRALKNKSTN